MSDPRTSLTRGTLSGLTSANIETVKTTFPITKTTPGQERSVAFQGMLVRSNQDPQIEGQMLLFQYWPTPQDRVIEVYIAINIDGALQWKTADLSATTRQD